MSIREVQSAQSTFKFLGRLIKTNYDKLDKTGKKSFSIANKLRLTLNSNVYQH